MLTTESQVLSPGIADIYHRLNRVYSLPPLYPRNNPLDVLIRAILSQNTTDSNSDKAFRQLKRAYSDWQSVIEGGRTSLENRIRVAGLARKKASAILNILTWINGIIGSFDMNFICTKDDDEALQLLTEQPGIGIKTASITLAFGCGKDFCAVDTHINRIARRIGWVPSNSTPHKTFQILRSMIPQGCALELHRLLIHHGHRTCKSGSPLCNRCPVTEFCFYGQSNTL